MKKKYLISSLSFVLALLFGLIFQLNTYATESEPLLGNPVIHQLGFVVNDVDKASGDFAKLFGVEKPSLFPMENLVTNSKFRGQSVGFDHKVTFISTPSIQIELIEPGQEPSTMGEFLNTFGEGVHHTSIAINNMQEKTELMENLGFPVVQSGDIVNDGGHFAFFDTSHSYKTLLELVEIKVDNPFPPNPPSGSPLLGTSTVKKIGIVVKNLDVAADAYSKLLGIEKSPVFYSTKSKNILFKTPSVEIELIEPNESSSIWKKHLETKGEGVHHIAFEVDNLKEKVQLLMKMGYPLIDIVVSKDGNTKYAYMDTTSTYKVVIELIEKK